MAIEGKASILACDVDRVACVVGLEFVNCEVR